MIMALFSIGCKTVDPKRQNSKEEELPVYVVTREQIDSMEDINVGQLFKIMDAKLPVFKEGATYKEIFEQINQTNNQILEETSDYILVQSFVVQKSNGNKKSSFKTIYYFKDGVLDRGPIMVDTDK